MNLNLRKLLDKYSINNIHSESVKSTRYLLKNIDRLLDKNIDKGVSKTIMQLKYKLELLDKNGTILTSERCISSYSCNVVGRFLLSLYPTTEYIIVNDKQYSIKDFKELNNVSS